MSLSDRLHGQWRHSEKLRFLIVGGWNSVFGYGVFVLLYWLVGTRLHYVLLGAIAHFLAVTQSFLSQRMLVFRAQRHWTRQFVRFHLASLAALAINLALLSAFVEMLGLRLLLAQALALALTVAASYLMHKHYSFRATS